MATLILVHDTEREIATFVDADTQQGWGPAMIGPDAYDALQAFTLAVPFDIGTLTSSQAADAFRAFLDRAAGGAAEAASTPPESAMDATGPDPVADGAALAQATAEAASDVPPPAPADTDEAPTSPPQVTVVSCFNCGGTGTIEFGSDAEPQSCNMCQGTGKIAQAA